MDDSKRSEQNIEQVAELTYNPEGNAGSSKSPREIENLTGTSCSLV